MNFNLKNWIQVLALVLLCGFVACNEDDSATSACADTTDCGEHGVDCSEGTCVCELGWFGANCEQFDCSIVDGGCVNGDCQTDGTCDCDEGWYGPDCSSDTPNGETADCENIDCGENGTCIDGVCDCADGFFGTDCSSEDPCFDTECGLNQIAVAIDGQSCECECAEGFGGANCDIVLSAAYLGNYNVVSTCGINSFNSDIVEQTEGGVVIAGKVKITNFSNLVNPVTGGDVDIVADIIEDNTLNIFASTGNPGYTVNGSGAFTDSTFTVLQLNYNIIDNATGAEQNCMDTYAKL